MKGSRGWVTTALALALWAGSPPLPSRAEPGDEAGGTAKDPGTPPADPGAAPKDPGATDPKEPPPPDPKTPDEQDEEEKQRAEAAAAKAKAEEEAKKEEARVDALVKKFNERMRKPDPDEQIAALTDISATHHHLVAAALIPWLKPTVDPRVLATAISAARSQPFPEIGHAAETNFNAFSTNVPYAKSMVQLIGGSKDPKMITKLKSIIDGKEFSLEIKKEAVLALKEIGHRDAIPELIRLYKEFENKNLPTKDIPRKQALQSLVEDALDSITGAHMMNGKGWDLWWKDNEKTFQKAPKDGGAPK